MSGKQSRADSASRNNNASNAKYRQEDGHRCWLSGGVETIYVGDVLYDRSQRPDSMSEIEARVSPSQRC
jgi:hypothetical protein